MTDVHNPAIRSYNMSRIKSKNTKPEMLVRKYLHSKGIRFRLHDSKLPGKPDIVLPKYSCIIQVQGCFWHKHNGCKYFVVPKTRTNWWLAKINKTSIKDQENENKLNEMGWNTIVIWECELRGKQRDLTLNYLYERILYQLRNLTIH